MPADQPIELLNEGQGLSDREVAEVLDDSGLASALIEADDYDQERKRSPGEAPTFTGDEPPVQEVPSGQAVQPEQPQPAPPPQQQAPQAQPQAQQPPQQAQDPYSVLQQVQGAKAQAAAELQALNSNRDALVKEHGLAQVVAHEQHLRAFQSGLQQSEQQITTGLQQMQQQQAVQFQSWVAQTKAQMRDALGVDNQTFQELTNEARQLMLSSGATLEEVNQLSDPRVAMAMMKAAQDRREAKRNKELVRKAARTAVRKQAAAQPPSDQPRWHKHGLKADKYTPGDGSLAEAAAAFEKMDGLL